MHGRLVVRACTLGYTAGVSNRGGEQMAARRRIQASLSTRQPAQNGSAQVHCKLNEPLTSPGRTLCGGVRR
jgi:apolipoprotein N-acyltransferase